MSALVGSAVLGGVVSSIVGVLVGRDDGWYVGSWAGPVVRHKVEKEYTANTRSLLATVIPNL